MVPRREQLVAMLDWRAPDAADRRQRALAYLAGMLAGVALAAALIVGLFPAG